MEPLNGGRGRDRGRAPRLGRRAALGLTLSGLGWLAAVRLGLAAEGRAGGVTGAAGAPDGAVPPDRPPMSLIVLWLAGGPSQLETFDPRPGRRVAGPGRAIPTRVPGLSLGEHLPQVAEQADKLAILRGVMGKEGDHERATIMMKTGRRPEFGLVHPALGAMCAAELPEEGTEIPRYISILGDGAASRGGYLGQAHDAFRLGDPIEPLRDVAAAVPPERLDRRLADLDVVERSFAESHPAAHARAQHAARTARGLRTMRSPQLRAFRVEEEPAALRRAYGDTPFGRGCLAARRLIEVGVRCVEVTLGGWDTHIDHFEANAKLCAELDPGMATLLRDLSERDLLRRTVVLCAGEFGRTPNINATDGRDHWPHGFSLALAGGPLRAGQVIGETGPDGEAPPAPIPVADVCATVLSAMGIDPAREHQAPGGRPVKLSDGKVIAGLLA